MNVNTPIRDGRDRSGPAAAIAAAANRGAYTELFPLAPPGLPVGQALGAVRGSCTLSVTWALGVCVFVTEVHFVKGRAASRTERDEVRPNP